MKKLLMLIAFTITMLSANAQLQVIQGAAMEAYVGKTLSIYNVIPREYEEASVYGLEGEYGTFNCIYKLGLKFKKLELVSLTTIFFNKGKTFQFDPTQSIFKIDLIYHLSKKFKIELGHECDHPITADPDRRTYEIYGGYTTKLGIYYNM